MPSNSTINRTSETEAKICDPGGKGFIFPLFESEQHSPPLVRSLVYIVVLCYIFYGVSIAADKFMEAIFTITSKKVRSKTRDGRTQTTLRWNKTVANLTLMALGSSAPEIILSIVEVVGNEFHSGALGPSTIVGSAAFNLFVIIAVCVQAVPCLETRSIQEYNVFIITAVFSIIAYLWLLFIVQLNSPDVVEPLEAIVTLLFFPVLIIISYMADVGYFNAGGKDAVKSKNPALTSHADHQVPALVNLNRATTWPPPWKICRNPSRPWKISANAVINSSFTKPVVRDASGKIIVNKAGIFCFEREALEIIGGNQEYEIKVPVWRRNGWTGIVSCHYCTEPDTATPGKDYVHDSGCLTFLQGEDVQEICITILPKMRWEREDIFRIVLTKATGGAIFNPNDDGGDDSCILTVTIANTAPHTVLTYIDKAINVDKTCLGLTQWKEDIRASVFDVPVADEDEDRGPIFVDYFLHVISIPWKLPIALVCPPSILLGGWLCFGTAIALIGGLTILIIDFAELFGCVTGVQDSITAITFVALGTSMPDLFASRTAAIEDDTADASIVNVTGSNSVNVFLGIGIPWVIASVYWASVSPTELWLEKYADEFLDEYKNGAFIVKGGDLGFSVIVFVIAACFALGLLRLRRTYFDGELGGNNGPKWMSAVLLFMLWVFYVALSIWKVGDEAAGFGKQVLAIGIALIVLEHVVGIIGIVLGYLGFFSSSPRDEIEKDVEAPARDYETDKDPFTAALDDVFQTYQGAKPAARPHAEPLRSDGIDLHFDDVAYTHRISFGGVAMTCLAVTKFKFRRLAKLAQKSRRINFASRETRSGDLRRQTFRPQFPHEESHEPLIPTLGPPPVDTFAGSSAFYSAGSPDGARILVDVSSEQRPLRFTSIASTCLAVVKFKRLRRAKSAFGSGADPPQGLWTQLHGRERYSAPLGQAPDRVAHPPGPSAPPPLPPPAYSPSTTCSDLQPLLRLSFAQVAMTCLAIVKLRRYRRARRVLF